MCNEFMRAPQRPFRYCPPMKWFLTCTVVMVWLAASIAMAQHVTPPNHLQLDNESYVLADIIVDQAGAARIEQLWPQHGTTLRSVGVDRYGRPSVLVYDARKQLLQAQWIKEGAALAYAPQSFTTLESLLHIPVAARWNIGAQQAGKEIGNYRQVRVKIHAVAITKQQVFLNSSDHWKEDFTIYIPNTTLRKMDKITIENLKGKWVRVRGLIAWHYGPSIAVLNPQMMEIEDVDSD